MAYEDPQQELNDEISSSQEEEYSDFEALIRERYGDSSAPDAEDSGHSESVEQPEGESLPAEETPPPVIYPEFFEIDEGLKLDRQTALSYAQFEAFLAENPKVVEAIQQAVLAAQGADSEPITSPAPASATPEQQASTPPPNLDLENPEVAYLLEQINEQKKLTQEALDLVKRHESQLTTQTEATTQSIVDRAKASFQQERGLTSEQMDNLSKIAAQLNVLEGQLSPVDPVTQLPRKVDPLAAVEKALDIAYWTIPEYRDKEISRRLDANRKDQQKKQKLSSLGGSSGNTPREPQTPQTKEDIRNAMIREVAQAIGTPPSS